MKATGSNVSQRSGMSRLESAACSSRQTRSASPGCAYTRPVTHWSHAWPPPGSTTRSVYCSTQRAVD